MRPRTSWNPVEALDCVPGVNGLQGKVSSKRTHDSSGRIDRYPDACSLDSEGPER